MVLTVSFGLSPVIGLFCHRRQRKASTNLTPASRRQDHTTSPSASAPFVKSTNRVHRIPSRVRDDREPPLVGTRRRGYNFDLGQIGNGMFLKWDWTAQITLIRFNKFGHARSWLTPGGANPDPGQTADLAVMYGRPPVGKAFLVFRQTDRGAVMHTASRCGRWPRALMENADRIPIIAARCYAR